MTFPWQSWGEGAVEACRCLTEEYSLGECNRWRRGGSLSWNLHWDVASSPESVTSWGLGTGRIWVTNCCELTLTHNVIYKGMPIWGEHSLWVHICAM